MLPSVALSVAGHEIVLRAAHTSVWVAVLAAIALTVWWAGALEALPRAAVLRALVVLAVVVLAGGRLHHVLNSPGVYAGRWGEAFALWRGTYHLPGGMIALVLAAPVVCRRAGVPVGRFADVLAPAIGIGIAIARLGCFLQGCCFGRLCERAWCFGFPAGTEPHRYQALIRQIPADAAVSLPIHPLPLYFLAAGLLVTAACLAVHRRKRYDGQAALMACVLFSATSAALEYFRADVSLRVYWGPLPQLAWTAIAMTVVSVAVLVRFEVRARRATALPAPA